MCRRVFCCWPCMQHKESAPITTTELDTVKMTLPILARKVTCLSELGRAIFISQPIDVAAASTLLSAEVMEGFRFPCLVITLILEELCVRDVASHSEK